MGSETWHEAIEATLQHEARERARCKHPLVEVKALSRHSLRGYVRVCAFCGDELEPVGVERKP